MSGGSFDYLCYKDGERLLEWQVLEMLDSMQNQLMAWAPESKAYKDTAALHKELREIRSRLDNLPDSRLAEVWHDVEWAVSLDIGEKDALKTIQEYEAYKAAHD